MSMHRCLAVAAGLAAALFAPAAPAAAEEPAVCHVGYRTSGDSRTFNGQVTITNTGPVTLYGWTLKFSLPAGQVFRSGWEARFTVDGQDVTGHSLQYNGVVDRGESVSVYFRAYGDVRGSRPAGFRINDQPCTTG
ncbi:cellulose binding domain-containing protein [Actinoplanes sp. NPDC049118]|uniref:cellulose binding domain-containing protein n=1 Tax=Actinoplanes sp. NPDC049118 TaxID=3155769 RepID=UPI0033F60F7A